MFHVALLSQLNHHGGCRCPGAYLAPGHQKPSWWQRLLHTSSALQLCWIRGINKCIFNTLRSGQNGRHFTDDIFKCICLNENIWILINISLKFVPKGKINNIPALVQIMAWHHLGNKPLSEPMIVSLLMYMCHWVNNLTAKSPIAHLCCGYSWGHFTNQLGFQNANLIKIYFALTYTKNSDTSDQKFCICAWWQSSCRGGYKITVQWIQRVQRKTNCDYIDFWIMC